MRKLIVFDAMGVVYKTSDDVADLLIPYLKTKDSTIQDDKVQELYHILSLGQITSQHFFERLGFIKSYPRIEKEYLDACLKLDETFIPTIQRLKETYNIAMLSNDVSNWSKHLRVKFDLDKHFIECIISGDVGYRKPSREIYQVILDKTGYNAKDCVFIDDVKENLSVAQGIGFKTIWFNRNNLNENYIGNVICSHKDLPNVLDKIFK